MNLIEQLGGYEKAKDHRDYLIDFGNEFNRPNKYEVNKINNALLEYRRQHNIFEVGDWFVSDTVLKPFKIVERYGDYLKLWSKEHTIEFSGNAETIIAIFRNPRHATDAEIKAGERLESCQ